MEEFLNTQKNVSLGDISNSNYSVLFNQVNTAPCYKALTAVIYMRVLQIVLCYVTLSPACWS